MAQGVLPFKYEEEKRDTGMTGPAGLPVYLDLASVMGINDSIEKHLHIKQQSWTDRQTLLSLVLTNLAGGDFVDDLRKLEGNSGFCKVSRKNRCALGSSFIFSLSDKCSLNLTNCISEYRRR